MLMATERISTLCPTRRKTKAGVEVIDGGAGLALLSRSSPVGCRPTDRQRCTRRVAGQVCEVDTSIALADSVDCSSLSNNTLTNNRYLGIGLFDGRFTSCVGGQPRRSDRFCDMRAIGPGNDERTSVRVIAPSYSGRTVGSSHSTWR